MSVVREDVWSREDSEEVIFERRFACRTTGQCKQPVLEYLVRFEGPHNLSLHRRLLLFQRFQLRIQLPGRDVVLVHPCAAFRL